MFTSDVGRSAAAHVLVAAVLTLAASSAVQAQSPTAVSQPPRTQEFGIDAGAIIGLGDDSYTQIQLPASRARIGFFLTNESRWSLEPALGLSYFDSEGGDGSLNYDLEFGALYHFRPTGDITGRLPTGAERTARQSVTYVRPFVNLSGNTGGGSDSRVSVGAGLGIKTPFRESLAFRYEANLGYDLDNEAARLGVAVGLSFFTRNLIR